MKLADLTPLTLDDARTFDNIPWHEPAFSERMLAEHLDQAHDLASRRESIIDQQVTFIGSLLPAGGHILDLGCGPGLYANRLASNGFRVTGVDWSPASIRHARANASDGATFIEADLRDMAPGEGFDLAMMLYGEFNVFSESDIQQILSVTAGALNPGGKLVLEINSGNVLRERVDQSGRFRIMDSGLFSASPHLLLDEAVWDDFDATLVTRYTVIDLESGNVNRYGATYKAWIDVELHALMQSTGFSAPTQLPDLGVDAGFDGFILLAERKAP